MEEIQYFEYNEDYCISVCNRQIWKKLKCTIYLIQHLNIWADRSCHSHLVQCIWGPKSSPSSMEGRPTNFFKFVGNGVYGCLSVSAVTDEEKGAASYKLEHMGNMLPLTIKSKYLVTKVEKVMKRLMIL